MNIFYLDRNPVKCAKYMVDQHIIKMVCETAQILSTAHRVLDGRIDYIISPTGRKVRRYFLNNYKEECLPLATHVNHPSTVWARSTTENYKWLYDHFIALLEEFEYRRHKEHSYISLVCPLSKHPNNMPIGKFSPPPCAMLDQYIISDDTITNYRNYYKHGKKHLHKWTDRRRPRWII